MVHLLSSLALVWLCSMQIISAITVDWENTDSIKAAAKVTATDMIRYFVGKQSDGTIGVLLLPRPYYWWEAGALMGGLIDYWKYTGDSSYNDFVIEILQSQVGPHNDFMPPEQRSSLGNDDQAFWALAAMSAAESKFPDPPNPKHPGWLSLVQAVFNEQVGRWDTSLCNGGLRWQIYEVTGYDLKNTISNGCLFNIAARLARYTGDQKYADWAVKIWDWMERIGLISSTFNIFDNAEAQKLNCTELDRNQWTYNAGTMLMGAATMYNYTDGSELWKNRTTSLLSELASDFFPGGIMREICEQREVCNPDQKSFKAYLARWMAASTKMAPFTYSTSYPLLLSSATAAAEQCNGGANGTLCGIKWWLNGTWDGSNGPGQQMCALEVIQSTLIRHVGAPVTAGGGGTSVGNPDAGFNQSAVPFDLRHVPAKKKDVIGAWIVTAAMLIAVVVMWVFMSTALGEWDGSSLAGKKDFSAVSSLKTGGVLWRKKSKGKGKEREEKPEPFPEFPNLDESRRCNVTRTPVRRPAMLEYSLPNASLMSVPEGTPASISRKVSAAILSPVIEQEGLADTIASLPVYKGGVEKT
ncbi:related to mannan endo-1,6-alpha-mannosidase DCW1 precursor [Rhynchosporium graminicola]|uniref:mannan endo-1,6-alpha-mannosidase n=1 Tax=Rhynchosporium graminicola TaxID=2792576 RepID=A0A1E1KQL9_9HELO|nr:related to mannan endo-1,6-alpha-mannosidase DCW1 precursor [Rhynchosporium commune]